MDAYVVLVVSFSVPFFYSGAVAAGPSDFVDCVNRGDTLTGVCKDLVICLGEGNSAFHVFQEHMDGSGIHIVASVDDMFDALDEIEF